MEGWEKRQISLGPNVAHKGELFRGALLPRGTPASYGADDNADAACAATADDPDADPEVHGGKPAEALWRKAAARTNWAAVFATIHGPQCPECAAIEGPGRCELHRPAPGAEVRWWHETRQGINPDPALAQLSADADAREAVARANSGAWRGEWAELREAQLGLQGQGTRATPKRLAPGGPESIEAVSQGFEGQISALVSEQGWQREAAEGYTLLTCGGAAAMAQAARLGAGGFAASRRLVGTVLIQQARRAAAAAVAEPPPPPPPPNVYANLTDLVAADPAWGRLAAAELNFSLTTSAVVLCNHDDQGFQAARGLHVHVSRGGVREWVATDSDVVCFVSERRPGDAESSPRLVDPRECSGGPRGRHHAMVHVGGKGYHLPPGAAVTLLSMADRFRAHGQSINRKLYTVSVAFGFELEPDLKGQGQPALDAAWGCEAAPAALPAAPPPDVLPPDAPSPDARGAAARRDSSPLVPKLPKPDEARLFAADEPLPLEAGGDGVVGGGGWEGGWACAECGRTAKSGSHRRWCSYAGGHF